MTKFKACILLTLTCSVCSIHDSEENNSIDKMIPIQENFADDYNVDDQMKLDDNPEPRLSWVSFNGARVAEHPPPGVPIPPQEGHERYLKHKEVRDRIALHARRMFQDENRFMLQ